MCSYCPIYHSFQFFSSKFMKSAVCDKLTAYLENNKPPGGYTSVYMVPRKISQPNWHSLIFELCIDTMNPRESILSCQADLSKAFDFVDAAVLVRKLESEGVQKSPFKLVLFISGKQIPGSRDRPRNKIKIQNSSIRGQTISHQWGPSGINSQAVAFLGLHKMTLLMQ